MEKKPYYRSSAFGGVFVVITIGIIGLLGYFISHYGFILIPFIIGVYLYVKYSDNSNIETEQKILDTTYRADSELNKLVEEDKNKTDKPNSELLSDKELFGIESMLSVVVSDPNLDIRYFKTIFLKNKSFSVETEIYNNIEDTTFKISKVFNSSDELNDEIKKKVLKLCSI
jgi:hypothetical protein